MNYNAIVAKKLACLDTSNVKREGWLVRATATFIACKVTDWLSAQETLLQKISRGGAI